METESRQSQVKGKIDDGQRSASRTFYPPFIKVDSEAGCVGAWEAFEKRYGKGNS